MEALGVAFGLGAAALWGSGDFAGGLASKRAPLMAVVVPSQLVGLLLVVALALAEPLPGVSTLVWGLLGGLAGGIGIAALYRGLAVGTMGVVAPISGVGAAALPVLVGVALGEQPSLVQIGGVGAALVAVVLVARPVPVDGGPSTGGSGEWKERSPSTVHRSKVEQSLLLAGVAALGFGLFFVLLDQAGSGGTFWPLVAARSGSVTLLGLGSLVFRRSVTPPRAVLGLVVLSGVLDMAANGSYILGAQRGLLSLVAVLSSLYPVGTVILARLLIGERLAPGQQVGVVLAVIGAALIAAG